ncbi:MAG: hypothetical protein AABX98_03630 [Nanoarchaeota archaeon]
MTIDHILSSSECARFIAASDQISRFRLGKLYFHGSFAEQNVRVLVRYAWENHWRQQYSIPEFVHAADVQSVLGRGVYSVFNLHNSPQDLLVQCLGGYGVFVDSKCDVYLVHSDESSRSRFEDAFFQGGYAISNVRKIVRYAWKHIWKKRYLIPEVVGWADIKEALGDGVYTGVKSLEVRRGNSIALFSAVFASYGSLRFGKASVCVSLYEDGLEDFTFAQHRELRKKFDRIFFSPENPQFDSNAPLYLAAFCVRHQISSTSVSSYHNLLPKPLR